MNLRKLRLIEEAKKSFGSLSINEALLAYLRRFYDSATSVAELVSKYLRGVFNAPNFDGVDDYAVLPYRAINPDGDIDIEFQTGPIVPAAGGQDYAVLSQCLTATFGGATGKEFTLYFNSSVGALQVLHGGNFFSSAPMATIAPNKNYRWTLQGNTQTFYVNGVQVFSGPVTRGTAREPLAVTVLCAQTHGTATTFRAFGRGIFYNIRINGTLWRMADRNQAIQLPEPSGLGAELITPTVLENPAINGSQWTYLGAGRWQYIGDGSPNALVFISFSLQPAAGFVEFEVESISGGEMRCSLNGTPNNASDTKFSTVGVKRYFFTNRDTTNGFQFVRNSSTPINCIIKNISFKPLAVVNSTELVTNGDFSAGTTGWNVLAGGSLSVTSGQATLTTSAGQASRFETTVAMEAGSYYEASFDLISVSGVSSARLTMYRGAAGSFAKLADVNRNAAGKLSVIFMATGSDGIIGVWGDSTNAGTVVVDNVSLRKLDSLCNPMTLVNVTSDRWQEVPQ